MSADQHRLSLRILVLGLLSSWLWKYSLWWTVLRASASQPLEDPFFPALMQRFDVLLVALLLPILIGLTASCVPSARWLAAGCASFAASSALLLLHQSTYNDATFVTVLWSALWGLWLFSARPDSAFAQQTLTARAAMLSQLLMGLWFLGGAIGKCTPGYLDGSVLHDLYFVDRDYLPFVLARRLWRGEALSVVARAYSFIVFVTECALATLPLWPPRLAMHFATLAMVCICLVNNPQLFSVFAAPTAMCIAVLRLLRENDHEVAEAQRAGQSVTPSQPCRDALPEQIIGQR